MILYSLNNSYPTKIPDRLRLPNGLTRTDPDTYTAEEITLAGYIPIEVPDYDVETEQLIWTGTEFLVELIPPPPPKPDWDNFNFLMMSNVRFNQVYGLCFQRAPIVASALPTALAQVTTHGNTLFGQVYKQICLLGGATVEDKKNWYNYGVENHLPIDFCEILRGEN